MKTIKELVDKVLIENYEYNGFSGGDQVMNIVIEYDVYELMKEYAKQVIDEIASNPDHYMGVEIWNNGQTMSGIANKDTFEELKNSLK